MAEPIVDLNLGPQAQQPSAANPLGVASTALDLQQKQNAIQLFRQEWAARQAAGQIMSAAPDEQSGYDQLRRNPLTAAFAPQFMTQMLDNRARMIQMGGAIQEQSNSALEGVYKTIGAAMQHPEQFEDLWRTGIGTIPPAVMKDFEGRGRNNPLSTIHDVLSNAAKAGPQTFNQVATALQLAHGVDPSRAFGQSGTVPPVLQPTAGGGAALRGGQGELQPQAPASVPPPASSVPSFTGASLVPDPQDLPKTRMDSQGLPIRDAATQKSVEDQLGRWNEAQPRYDIVAQNIARLHNVDDNIKTLAKDGGWLTPGAGGQFRAGLGNVINTVQQIVNPGSAPAIDPLKQAAAQDTMKESANLAFGLVNQLFGGSHQAFGTVQHALASVPGIENTPLGGLLLSDLLKAGGQWQLDQRTFKQNWLAQAHGDLTGSDTNFAQKFPPTDYVQKVLDKYGLSEGGFKSAQDVVKAVSDGLLTVPMGKKIVREQFPNDYK